MPEQNQPSPDFGFVTDTVKLVTNGEQIVVEILLDVTRLNQDRRELLLTHALRAASKAQLKIECMDDAEVNELVAKQRDMDAQHRITHSKP